MIRFEPTEADVGERLDLVIARRTGVTRAVARDAVSSGAVTVAGRAVKPAYRVERGDVVEGEVHAPVEALPEPEDVPLDIRYEDERVMVISKPAGLVAHPVGQRRDGTLVNALLGLGRPLGRLDPHRPGIVHRLDKDTSGLLLVAKDDETQRLLQGALKERRVERRYLALVRGVPSESGTIEAPVGRHPTRPTLMAVVPGGRPAVTHYSVIDSNDAMALLDVKLETGRTHQIRVHMAHISHPVVGDRVYGGVSEVSRTIGIDRPFLHAYRLRVPIGGGVVEVSDDLPRDLGAALERAGLLGI